MARPKRITLNPTALDRNGITASVDLGAAGTYDIDGALATLAFDRNGVQTAVTLAASGNMSLGAQMGAAGISFANPTFILIYGAGDESGVTFTVTGKGPSGSISNQITGPNNSTVYSADVFTRIDSIHATGVTSGDIEVGVLGNAVFTTPQHVTVYGAGDESGRTFTVTGIDRYGNQITETITGPNNTTVAGSSNFAVVTRIQVDADTAGAVEIGVDGTCQGPWFPLSLHGNEFNAGVQVNIGNTCTYSVQHTMDDVFSSTFDEDTAMAENHVGMTGLTADGTGSYVSPITACRLNITAHTSGNAVFTVIQ